MDFYFTMNNTDGFTKAQIGEMNDILENLVNDEMSIDEVHEIARQVVLDFGRNLNGREKE